MILLFIAYIGLISFIRDFLFAALASSAAFTVNMIKAKGDWYFISKIDFIHFLNFNRKTKHCWQKL